MDADDSVELGPTEPALEIPWQDPDGRLNYLDLRAEAGSLERLVEQIAEARQFPALRRFLIDLNSERSAWQTAKCDVWAETVEAEENLYGGGFAQNGYVDVVFAEPQAKLRGSLAFHRRIARELAELLGANRTLEATAEIVVRRCYFHHGPQQEVSDAGYCLTQFLTGYGASADEAASCWERAMEFAAGCWLGLQFRAKDRELS